MTQAAIPPGVVADAATAAKAWLRAAGNDETDTVATLCASAIALAEAFCGRTLVARAFAGTVAGDGRWHALGASPVGAVLGVTGAGGAALPVGDYAVDIDEGGVGWVRSVRADGAALAVAYVAGEAAAWDAVPPPIAQGVAMLVAHLFDDRAGAAQPPAAVAALWRPWRRLRLAPERRLDLSPERRA